MVKKILHDIRDKLMIKDNYTEKIYHRRLKQIAYIENRQSLITHIIVCMMSVCQTIGGYILAYLEIYMDLVSLSIVINFHKLQVITPPIANFHFPIFSQNTRPASGP